MEEASLGSGHRIHRSSFRVENGTVQIKHCNADQVKTAQVSQFFYLSGMLSQQISIINSTTLQN